jgi:hypothetical protein
VPIVTFDKVEVQNKIIVNHETTLNLDIINDNTVTYRAIARQQISKEAFSLIERLCFVRGPGAKKAI